MDDAFVSISLSGDAPPLYYITNFNTLSFNRTVYQIPPSVVPSGTQVSAHLCRLEGTLFWPRALKRIHISVQGDYQPGHHFHRVIWWPHGAHPRRRTDHLADAAVHPDHQRQHVRWFQCAGYRLHPQLRCCPCSLLFSAAGSEACDALCAQTSLSNLIAPRSCLIAAQAT